MFCRFAGMLSLIDVETDQTVPISVQHDGIDKAPVTSDDKGLRYNLIFLITQCFWHHLNISASMSSIIFQLVDIALE